MEQLAKAAYSILAWHNRFYGKILIKHHQLIKQLKFQSERPDSALGFWFTRSNGMNERNSITRMEEPDERMHQGFIYGLCSTDDYDSSRPSRRGGQRQGSFDLLARRNALRKGPEIRS